MTRNHCQSQLTLPGEPFDIWWFPNWFAACHVCTAATVGVQNGRRAACLLGFGWWCFSLYLLTVIMTVHRDGTLQIAVIVCCDNYEPFRWQRFRLHCCVVLPQMCRGWPLFLSHLRCPVVHYNTKQYKTSYNSVWNKIKTYKILRVKKSLGTCSVKLVHSRQHTSPAPIPSHSTYLSPQPTPTRKGRHLHTHMFAHTCINTHTHTHAVTHAVTH